MKSSLILPMATQFLYMVGVLLYMLKTRVDGVKNGQISGKYFKTYFGTPPPERIQLVGRHYDNQFQVPMLFFATAAVTMILGAVTPFTQTLAWIFVVSRFVHGWIHLGSNKILRRMMAFATGWIVLLIWWINLTISSLQ